MVHSQANFVCYKSRAWKMVNLNGQVKKRHVAATCSTHTENYSLKRCLKRGTLLISPPLGQAHCLPESTILGIFKPKVKKNSPLER